MRNDGVGSSLVRTLVTRRTRLKMTLLFYKVK